MGARVVMLDDYRKPTGGPVVCVTCGDNWWAVRSPIVCPHCETMTGYSFDWMLKTVSKHFGEVFAERMKLAAELEFDA